MYLAGLCVISLSLTKENMFLTRILDFDLEV